MLLRSSRSPEAASAGKRRGRIGRAEPSSRRPAVIAGLTAFAVAFSYVSANAIWYQPHAHDAVFFATRPKAASVQEEADGATLIRIEREEGEIEAPAAAGVPALPASVPAPPREGAAGGEPTVRDVQAVLAELNLYEGAVDGLSGPQTRAAIEAYQKLVGLNVTGAIDAELVGQLGLAAAPAPPPRLNVSASGTDGIATSSARRDPDPRLMRIQAGLKAFGNDGIEPDGVIGERTRAAIVEFQSLFGLEVTGEPDAALYAKMQEIGLTD